MSLVIIVLIVVPVFMLLSSVIILATRKSNAEPMTAESGKQLAKATSAISQDEMFILRRELANSQKLLEENKQRTPQMENMISRLAKTVEQLNSDIQNEKIEKMQLQSDIATTRQLAAQATEMMNLVREKEHGADWRVRLDAELRLTGGGCTDISLQMGREIEATVKRMFVNNLKPPHGRTPFFAEMTKALQESKYLSFGEAEFVFKAWRIRNTLAHESKVRANQKQGELLLQALDILETRERELDS
jgi:TolA-binding protein